MGMAFLKQDASAMDTAFLEPDASAEDTPFLEHDAPLAEPDAPAMDDAPFLNKPDEKLVSSGATDELYDGSDAMQKCAEEILCFIRGGLPGASRLKQVLSSVFIYYQVLGLDHREQILRACGLQPVQLEEGNDVTFLLRGYPCLNPFREPVDRRRLNHEGVVDEEPFESTTSEE
jgi:hypothetical protein